MKNKVGLKPLRGFIILWTGQFLSQLGSALTGFAITIWAYEKTGSALVLSVSGILVLLPRMAGGILAGPLVERWNKKTVILVTDLAQGACSLVLLCLLLLGSLEVWQIYCINIATSLLGSLQAPASEVAVTLLVPKSHYTRASGLQAFSGGAVQILAPVLAAVLLTLGGMGVVVLFDLLSLLLACLTLGLLVTLPEQEAAAGKGRLLRMAYGEELAQGFGQLWKRPLLKRLLLFFSFMNLAAGMTYYNLLSPMILARTGNNAGVLALVNGAVGAGTVAGGVLCALLPAPKRKVRVMFACAFASFLLGDLLLAAGRIPAVWMAAGFLSSVLLPLLNANEKYLWRTGIEVRY